MQIRDAEVRDLPEITEIHNDAVRKTTAIWTEVVIDIEDRRTWLADRENAGYPVLVAVADDGKVLGFATFGDWRTKEGYRYTVEHSVYIRSDCRGAGIGRALMAILIDRARAIGKHAMVAAIEASNIESIRLHERLDFEHAGQLREVGTKFGRWLDLAFMQLVLDPRPYPEPTDAR